MENEFNFGSERNVDSLGKEAAKIQKLLERCLDENMAVEVASEIYSAAVEVDILVDELKQDREFLEKYKYDGVNFEDKNTKEEYRVLDGLNLLRSLCYTFQQEYASQEEKDGTSFLFQAGGPAVVDTIREWLDFCKENMKSCLESWKKERSLAPDSETEDGNEPLSPEQKKFFKIYEEQMTKSFKEDTGGRNEVA